MEDIRTQIFLIAGKEVPYDNTFSPKTAHQWVKDLFAIEDWMVSPQK